MRDVLGFRGVILAQHIRREMPEDYNNARNRSCVFRPGLHSAAGSANSNERSYGESPDSPPGAGSARDAHNGRDSDETFMEDSPCQGLLGSGNKDHADLLTVPGCLE